MLEGHISISVTLDALRGTETVLVVDDDSTVRQPIVRILEAFGYEVLVARSGHKALTIMDEHRGPVHLVVSDVLMPEMDGAELATMLRDFYPRLSVLLMSGNGSGVFEIVGIPQPAGTHFIRKPFRPEELGQTVRRILDAEWKSKKAGEGADTQLIRITEEEMRAEKRAGARKRAYRIVAECEFLMNEMVHSEQRNWSDAFGRVLVAARRLIALTSPGGEPMFGPDMEPTAQFKDVQADIIAAANAVTVAAASAPRDNIVARGIHSIRELAQHLYTGLEESAPAQASSGVALAPAGPEQRPTVLIVDDDASVLKFLKRSLESWGLDVVTATDGREGLAVLASKRIDLVLTDIEMPNLDGMAMLSAIKANPETQRIPVIVISSKDDLDSVSKCIELGAEDHISKPFANQVLSARVKATLERKQLHDAESATLRRIGQLIAAAEAVERDTYAPDALDSLKAGSDGLGQLARVFDRMVSGLKSKEERLRQRVKGLRTEVGEARVSGAKPLGSDSPFALGDAVADRFEIIGQLGRGGMGTVYLALDRQLNEEVALKVVRKELLENDPQILERLKSEIRLARKISHPNVVRAHDIGEWQGRYFITMEKVVGVTVAELLDQRGRLTAESTLAIGTQLCEALAVAHDNDIIHRDVKPANLLIDEAGTLKVMDFGIARRLTAGAGQLTKDGFLVGTPQYMAPELLTSGKPNARTDLFAVGVVLYECVTGRLPYDGESAMELYAAVLDDQCPRAGTVAKGVSPQFEALIHQQLRFDPNQRATSARELSQRLSELEQTKPA
jgi:DNA-binding response OmpR family regulator